MRNIKSVWIAIGICYLISACNSSMRVLATWVDKPKVRALPKARHKVFVMVMTQNFEVQAALENDLAKAAGDRGVDIVKSIDAFGPLVTKGSLPSKEIMLAAIRNQGCDGIFFITLVDKNSETYYRPSSVTTYTPYPGFGYWGSYYNYAFTVYDPGYYAETKTYFVQSNLYSAQTEELLVAMQSKLVNPGAVQKASKKYTALLIEELEKQGFLQNSTAKP